METNIQKINPLYLLAYIIAPIAICVIGYSLCYLCFYDGGVGAVITTMIPTIAAIIWWIFGGTLILKKKTKELEKRFTDEGYHRNQTFYGRGQTVVVDVDKGILGVVFFWNPFDTYVIPATRITNAWVDDGRRGAGVLEGSSYVSFSFCIDNKIKIKVYTFTSNQRFTMNDKRILTGIAKAEKMVKALETAKEVAESSKTQKSSKESKSNKTEENPKKDTSSNKK